MALETLRYALRLLSQPSLLFYKAHSTIHSRPRVQIAGAAIDSLLKSGIRLSRIVDYGCGLGDFAPIAEHLGLEYCGLDVNASALRLCELRFGSRRKMRFIDISDSSARPPIVGSDVVVLNGVAHHLDDTQFQSVLSSCREAAAVLILDHVKVPAVAGAISGLQFALQALDKGKHVRPLQFFDVLTGFDMISEKSFSISAAGVTLWNYFCRVYRPV